MFKKAKNIDTAFRQTKILSIIIIISAMGFSAFCLWKSVTAISNAQNRIYILAAGKAMEALSSDRTQNIPVELRQHVKNFHQAFYGLSPDEKVIKEEITKALYLADGSAKAQYDNLVEQGYYRNFISGNVNQRITVDSIRLDLSHEPYSFQFHGKLHIVRPTSTVVRNLITEGRLRSVKRSDHNPHGFLIERFQVIDNKDISVKER